MYSVLTISEQKATSEKALQRAHNELVKLVAESHSADGNLSTQSGFVDALKRQQVAWLKYSKEECWLFGRIAGGGSDAWKLSHSVRCEANLTGRRLLRVKSATRCIQKFPADKRIFEQENCLQQLLPLVNKQ